MQALGGVIGAAAFGDQRLYRTGLLDHVEVLVDVLGDRRGDQRDPITRDGIIDGDVQLGAAVLCAAASRRHPLMTTQRVSIPSSG